MLKTDCKHIDEYINTAPGLYTDWCLLHDCFNCDICECYEKNK